MLVVLLFHSSFLFYLFANAMLPLVFQASLIFDGMVGKAKVTDVNDAIGLTDTMSIGNLFTKKAKKNLRKASEPSKETGVKKARLASAEEVGTTHPIPSPVVSPDVSDSEL